jgi:hypothetical protein
LPHSNIAFILFYFVPEELDFVSRQQLDHIPELQNNYAQHERYKHLCSGSEEHQLTSDVHKESCMQQYISKKHLHLHHEKYVCDVCKKPFIHASTLK